MHASRHASIRQLGEKEHQSKHTDWPHKHRIKSVVFMWLLSSTRARASRMVQKKQMFDLYALEFPALQLPSSVALHLRKCGTSECREPRIAHALLKAANAGIMLFLRFKMSTRLCRQVGCRLGCSPGWPSVLLTAFVCFWFCFPTEHKPWRDSVLACTTCQSNVSSCATKL